MQCRWSVVIPYYNEANYLPSTLASLCIQTMQGFKLILVDNASTDGSPEICRRQMAESRGIACVHSKESRPGQVHALQSGIAQVDTEFVAICDADTVYPPHYLELADRIYRDSPPDVVAVLGLGVNGDPDSWQSRLVRAKGVAVSRLLARQSHSGGYAHTFRTAALRQAGGYDKDLWPYVLKDQELIHRILKIGRTRYHYDLWCRPSPRRADRSAVRWTLAERLLYHATAYPAKDWFFYRFLAARLARRKMDEIRLRERSWF